MKRGLRFFGYALVAIGSAAWLVQVYLFLDFANTRQHFPQPEFGRTVALNNHGNIVYLTADEKNLLNWLSYGALTAFAVGAIVIARTLPTRRKEP